jgi:hypothetical protein
MSGDYNFSADFECNRCGAGVSGIVDLICDYGYEALVVVCDDCQIAEVVLVGGGHDNPDTPENRAAWEEFGPMLERGEKLLAEEQAKRDDEVRRADW